MKQSNLMMAVLILGLILACFGNAQAQLLLEQGGVDAMSARMNLQSLARSVPESAILERLKMQGYKDVKAVTGAQYQFSAISPAGMPVTVTAEPYTGQVISVAPR